MLLDFVDNADEIWGQVLVYAMASLPLSNPLAAPLVGILVDSLPIPPRVSNGASERTHIPEAPFPNTGPTLLSLHHWYFLLSSY